MSPGPLGAVWWQAVLDGLGAFLAFLYELVGNYGVAIILLTLAVRIALLPLGVKQIRSMQRLQELQPRIRALQQKYKGNRQKLNEEMMRLYREHDVNPLGGCLPMLAQIPVLIALFAVLQYPNGLTHIPHSDANPVVGTPQDSQLYVDLVKQAPGSRFLGANLLCSAAQAGKQVSAPAGTAVPDAPRRLDCGTGIPARIPYYALAGAMILTTYYQQRQMQRAQPGGGQQQQQAIMRLMPLLFGFWGIIFPAGLVLYWTTTNVVQIVQQHFMLPKPARERGMVAAREAVARLGWRLGVWRPAGDQRASERAGGDEAVRAREGGGRVPSAGARGTGDGRGRKKRRKR
ncbi:MAG TPA: YidC/Oxa1 family membrane protein insertase [Actinomycetota bacterium]|nr:YidC/Oxa1 family membrane protein insertase [Actinomycetota bacterium]